MRVSRRERFIHRLSGWSGVRDGEMLPRWAHALRWILCPLETYGRWYAANRFGRYDFAHNAFTVDGQQISVQFLSNFIKACDRGRVLKLNRDDNGYVFIEDVTDWWREMGKGRAS